MARVALLVLFVAGCLAEPTRGTEEDADPGSSGDGSAGCDVLVGDTFEGGEVDLDLWIVATSNGGNVLLDAERLKLVTAGDSDKDPVRASVVSRDQHLLANTHVVVRLIGYNDNPQDGDASLTWFRGLDDYYAIYLRDGEIQATHADEEGDEEDLCEPSCPAYGDGSKVLARMAATESEVLLAVSNDDGETWHDFVVAPNSGSPYAVRVASIAFEASVEVLVDDVTWYDCPPDE